MKKAIPHLFACLLTLNFLQANEYVPRDVQRIIDIRKAEIRKIDEQYRTALEKLKVRYTQSGDLDNALLINQLIEENRNGNQSDPYQHPILGEWEFSYQ